MKKLFVFLGVFCALCFVACSNFQLAGGDMGVVSLSIGDNLAREIRSAASLRSATGGSYTLTASIRGEYSDSQTVTVADGNYSGVTFTFEDVPVGKRIILDLTAKADGNYIWYGNSGKHMVVSGINNLNVAVGRVSGVLLWKLENHNILTAPYGAYDSPAERGITFGVSDSSQGTPFCFDSDGNLYVMPSDGFTVKKYDLQLDGTYVDSKTNISTNTQAAFNHLAYDSVADVLYGIGENGALKCFKTNSQSFDQVQGDTVNSGSYLGLAAHNNVVYTAETGLYEGGDGEIVVSLSRYDLSAGSSQKLGEIRHQLPTVFGTAVSTLTGQMIYQDGALYLLLSRVSVDSMYPVEGDDMALGQSDGLAENYSLGAVLKINPDTLALDTRFGANGYLGLSSSKTSFSGITETGFNVTNGTVEYSGPDSSNDSSVFYGPQGFVAIMPKKLVIADAGFTMSKDGVQAKITKKSRIITVDLETLAFETKGVEDTYYQPSITPSGSGYEYIK